MKRAVKTENHAMRKTGMTLCELLIVTGVLVVLAVLLLPALATPPGPRRRSSCQNNLKQMGLIFKMYSNESKGQYPPVSSVPGNWVPSMAAIYPEYLTDPTIVVCPNSPLSHKGVFTLKDNREHPRAKVGSFHPDCAAPLFYVYTGYELLCDEDAWALGYARAAMPEGWLGRADIDVTARQGENAAPFLPVPKLKDTDGDASRISGVPVMWDRIGTAKDDSNHTPAGSNVLYADGHVEFKKYGNSNKTDSFPVTHAAAQVFGDGAPHRSRDCAE